MKVTLQQTNETENLAEKQLIGSSIAANRCQYLWDAKRVQPSREPKYVGRKEWRCMSEGKVTDCERRSERSVIVGQ
jgi:hypothetical protein